MLNRDSPADIAQPAHLTNESDEIQGVTKATWDIFFESTTTELMHRNALFQIKDLHVAGI